MYLHSSTLEMHLNNLSDVHDHKERIEYVSIIKHFKVFASSNEHTLEVSAHFDIIIIL